MEQKEKCGSLVEQRFEGLRCLLPPPRNLAQYMVFAYPTVDMNWDVGWLWWGCETDLIVGGFSGQLSFVVVRGGFCRIGGRTSSLLDCPFPLLRSDGDDLLEDLLL